MTRLRALAASPTRNDRGFTLIELLVVVAILGILAAIASQAFAKYRSNGFDALACNDLHAAAIAEEAQYSFSGVYLPCANAAVCQGLLRGYVPSAGVVLSIEATGSAFIGTATHPSGTRLWKFESDVGRFVFQTSGP